MTAVTPDDLHSFCTDCQHTFTYAEAHLEPWGSTFEARCPKCFSPHLLDYPIDEIDAQSFPQFVVPKRIVLRPVSTKGLEEQARRMLERIARELEA